ncbi:hypothetical protein F5884DRAFT_890807 [Xylogone sp. PMI_703]|nr:hypothetical protein F5884DRAFT_890807 [Xylogone sp. PMI_703]
MAGDSRDDDRDVVDIWQQALRNYKGIVRFDLKRKFDNTQAMIDFVTGEMNTFHKFRYNDKKVDRLRSLFATKIDYLEKSTQQLLSAVTPTFSPAAVIGTAITYFLMVISTDYDIIIVFFDNMNSFLERVVILETRLPSNKAYRNCLMDVFMSFLAVCGYVHKYIELGRFKKWISNLVTGEDADLGNARKKMDKDLARLHEVTEFVILGNSKELKKMNSELHIHQDTESICSNMAKFLKAFSEQNLKRECKGKPLAHDTSNHKYRILKETLMKQDDVNLRSVLALVRQPGIGKSHLAAAIHDELQKHAKTDSLQCTYVAHFYFREQHKDLYIFLGRITTIINQVTKQSALLYEKISAEMIRDDVSYNVWIWKHLLLKIFGPVFSSTSPNRLFIVFDGLDEIADHQAFLDFIKLAKNERFRISLLRIVEKVVEISPDLLYAEHALVRLNDLGREATVLNALSMPVAHQEWLVFQYKVFTLDEVTSLLVYLSEDDSFTLEEIPEDNRGNIFVVSKSIQDLERAEKTFINLDEIYNDSILLVGFRERSMRAFFRDSCKESPAWQLVEADPLGLGRKINSDLQGYVALYFFTHWCKIKPEEHLVLENTEVMEAFAAALTNLHFPEILSYTQVIYNKNIKNIAELLKTTEVKIYISSFAESWWSDVTVNLRTYCLGIARRFFCLLYRADTVDEVVRIYKLLHRLLSVINFPHEFPQESKANVEGVMKINNVNTNGYSQDMKDVNTRQILSQEKAVLGILSLFGDIEMDKLCLFCADTICQKVLDLYDGTNCVEKFKIMNLKAKILLKLHNKSKALQDLENAEIPGSLKRLALGALAAAAKSYAKAKAVDPTGQTPRDALVNELTFLIKRLTWMAWNYANVSRERHFNFRCTSIKEEERDFIVESYISIVEFFDRLNAGALLRVDLARAYLYVVFDSISDGYLYDITSEVPQDTLQRAIFRASRDPKVKAEALDALKELMKRPLSLNMLISSSLVLIHLRIVIFQTRLQSIFDDCFISLSDTLGHALTLLSKALPDGRDILRYACIITSALDSEVADGSECDSDSDSDDGNIREEANGNIKSSHTDTEKPPPEDEGDLDKDGGVRSPVAEFSWWGCSTAYYCTECSNTLICEECYKARNSPEEACLPKIMHFCDKGHRYIKLPVEGWGGVKDRKLRLEGDRPIDFSEFVKYLQDEVCKRAWDRFWYGA